MILEGLEAFLVWFQLLGNQSQARREFDAGLRPSRSILLAVRPGRGSLIRNFLNFAADLPIYRACLELVEWCRLWIPIGQG